MADTTLLTTAIFNPSLLSDDELVRAFVARQPLLNRLLDDLTKTEIGTTPQHQLIIGQRGMGKTTLLRRLAIAITADRRLARQWLPLRFPEEQYNVKNLADFWLNCADALSDELDRSGHKLEAEAVDRAVSLLPKDPEASANAALFLLTTQSDILGRGLVLLVDNLDIVLDRLSEKEEWAFRRVISDEHRLYFIGGSSRAMESFYEYGRAFYDYFRISELKAFDEHDMFALLQRVSDEGGDEQVKDVLATKPARIRALRVLTGGNPRTLMLLYRVLSQGPGGDVRRDLEQLLDLYTPLYKARFEEMAAQAQQVVDAMAIHWDPISAGEVAEKLGTMPVSQVSAQLKRLENYGVAEKVERYGDKKIAYQIAERFFNIWYLMRASRRERRKLLWLVRFLESWFEEEELEQYAEAMLGAESTSADEAEIRFVISQVVKNPHLRRGLASAGLRTAMNEQVRSTFDFTGLPLEVLEQKKRIEVLRELERRTLSAASPQANARELWRLLGGSPHLSIREKKAIVTRKIPSKFREASLRELLDKLARQERRLFQAFPDRREDVTKLYNAIASGEMSDALDVDGALTLERPRFEGLLPVVGAASQTIPYCSPDLLSEAQAAAIKECLNKLRNVSEYSQHCAWLEANLLRRSYHFAEAETKYREALAIDESCWLAWSGLANLLDGLGRHAEARSAVEAAIALQPDGALLRYNLGVILGHLGSWKDAETCYRKALTLDPQLGLAWYGLGRLLHEEWKQIDEAKEAYEKSLELEPDNISVWVSLGDLLQETSQKNYIEGSEAAYRRAILLDKDNAAAWINLGNLLQEKSERYDEAEAAYRTVLEANPDEFLAWNNLGNLLNDHLNRFVDAEEAYSHATALDSSSPLPWGGMARLLARDSERFDEMVAAIFRTGELALERFWNAGTTAQVILLVAATRLSDTLRLVVARYHERPKDSELGFLLVQLYLRNGEIDNAKELLTLLAAPSVEEDQPVVRGFSDWIKVGLVDDVIAILEATGASERWRPLYEALRAYNSGGAEFLLKVSPEIRAVSEVILQELKAGSRNQLLAAHTP